MRNKGHLENDPCEQKTAWDCPGQNLMGKGNLWLCRFLLELDHIDFGAPLPPTLAQVFTDFSTESQSPLDLQVRSPLFLQECL